MKDGTVHVTVGAAGFFLIQLSWVIRDGRNTTKWSWLYGRATVVNRTALLWEYVRNRDKKSLIMFGCITDSVNNTYNIIIIVHIIDFLM